MWRFCPSGSVTERGTVGVVGWREYPSGSHQSGGSSTRNTPTRLSLASENAATLPSSVPPRYSTSQDPVTSSNELINTTQSRREPSRAATAIAGDPHRLLGSEGKGDDDRALALDQTALYRDAARCHASCDRGTSGRSGRCAEDGRDHPFADRLRRRNHQDHHGS